MELLSIVGARPQFIKLAAFADAIERWNKKHSQSFIKHRILHTGQHYDKAMSDSFFDVLSIPTPDINLNIGAGTHGEQTARMIEGIEKELLSHRPTVVVAYGDTNSTLAGALAASKLHIPIAHIEAGMRSFNRTMPEEINRVVTDHLSDLLFCFSIDPVSNLRNEGIRKGVHRVGDPMKDIFLRTLSAKSFKHLRLDKELQPGHYGVLTLHRADIAKNHNRLIAVLDFLDKNSPHLPIVFPCHPGTRKILQKAGWNPKNATFHFLPPRGYVEMQKLISQCQVVLTDSGGLQKEAYWHHKPCITLRNESEWTELVKTGHNILVGYDVKKLRKALAVVASSGMECFPNLYGSGKAADRICQIIYKCFS